MTSRNIGAFVGHGLGGELGQRVYDCPVPLTVRGTQTLVSFAPLAFKLFYAARHNAVLRRSPFASHVHIVKLESLNANSWYQTTLRSAQQMKKDIQAQTKLAVKFKLQPA